MLVAGRFGVITKERCLPEATKPMFVRGTRSRRDLCRTLIVGRAVARFKFGSGDVCEVRMTITRRNVLGGGFAAIAASRLSATRAALKSHFEIEKSDAEWHQQLTPQQYEVLRKHGTERPGSSPLLNEHRKGTFECAGCDQALFSSEMKYESGTGWPSFWAPIRGAIETSEDHSYFILRTEVHCARCGGHLGHVFDDGPPPTGKRYCMNGIAMKFEPAAA
jgi:peptide-methionine (R)-S-oxide reductase